jgi:CubicO group peptidase (beta-lactamase class C family)
MIPRLLALALLGSLVLWQPASARGSDPGGVIRHLDATIPGELARWHVPGVAVAVVHDGLPLAARGYGRRAPGGPPMTPDTLFPLASVTKSFTALSVAMLTDEGRLDWTHPVHEVLPEFALAGAGGGRDVTLLDLLSHRSGLPRHDLVWFGDETLTRDELLRRLPNLATIGPPRSRYQYNNLMYGVAAAAAERASGLRWESWVETRIFGPLAMTRTTFDVEAVRADPDHATGTVATASGVESAPPYRNSEALRPAGGVFSSARDLARYAAFHVGDGTVGGRRLLGRTTLDALHRTQVVTGIEPSRPEVVPLGYGLGWFTQLYRGEPVFWHSGRLTGYTTLIVAVPRTRDAIVVLANAHSTELPYVIARGAIDRLLGRPPLDWSGILLASRHPSAPPSEASGAHAASTAPSPVPAAHSLADYAGTYRDPGYGTLTFLPGATGLVLSRGAQRWPLEHVAYGAFRIARFDPGDLWTWQTFRFQTDAQGTVAAVTASLEPQVPPVEFVRVGTDRRRATDLDCAPGRYDVSGAAVRIERTGDTLLWRDPDAPALPLRVGAGDEWIHPIEPDTVVRFECTPDHPTRLIKLGPRAVESSTRRIDPGDAAP